MTARIILIRHGQTDWNLTDRFRGMADVPLNATGLAQAEATGRRVALQWEPAAIYSSPLSRAVNTAEAVARHLLQEKGLDRNVEIEPSLADFNFGRWEGLTPKAAAGRWPEEMDAWCNHPEKARIPGGETLNDLRSRAAMAVEELVQRHPNETIVLVSHTNVIRILLLWAMKLGNECFWRIRQDTCAVNVLEREQGNWTVGSINDTCHLIALEE
jgi:probable phosphoglycerate mutase